MIAYNSRDANSPSQGPKPVVNHPHAYERVGKKTARQRSNETVSSQELQPGLKKAVTNHRQRRHLKSFSLSISPTPRFLKGVALQTTAGRGSVLEASEHACSQFMHRSHRPPGLRTTHPTMPNFSQVAQRADSLFSAMPFSSHPS